ncbi:hypothetical protein E2C01_070436 [Portunus trituberculatus]|uniref:Uncharacterized protein n=1 Tax=Portunus trituberculatus TaxID=210409 RepID=A0A5B7I1K8_PORTR|nr:hypothetical protein [Portunus trituberculatus]
MEIINKYNPLTGIDDTRFSAYYKEDSKKSRCVYG